jgi:CheY-like chemotaxis protein
MSGTRRAPRSRLIVVVDDDRLVLEAMGGLLRGWGYEVVTAVSDFRARELLASEARRPDLIICDYHLAAGVTGLEAIARLRGGSEIPAFIITAEASGELDAEAQARGIQVLHKPVAPTRLRRVLREALGHRSRR